MSSREPQSPLRDLPLYTIGLQRSLVYLCIKGDKTQSWRPTLQWPMDRSILFWPQSERHWKNCLRQSPVGERGFVEVQFSRWEFAAHHWITVEINTEVSKKKKTTTTLELPLYALAIPHLSIYLKEMKKESQRDVCTPMLTFPYSQHPG